MSRRMITSRYFSGIACMAPSTRSRISRWRTCRSGRGSVVGEKSAGITGDLQQTIQADDPASTDPPSDLVLGEIRGDGVDPGAELAAGPIPLAVDEHPQEHLLGDLLGPLAVADEPADEVDDPPPVPINQRRKRRLRVPDDVLHELLVRKARKQRDRYLVLAQLHGLRFLSNVYTRHRPPGSHPHSLRCRDSGGRLPRWLTPHGRPGGAGSPGRRDGVATPPDRRRGRRPGGPAARAPPPGGDGSPPPGETSRPPGAASPVLPRLRPRRNRPQP